jgi:hypothetical protein
MFVFRRGATGAKSRLDVAKMRASEPPHCTNMQQRVELVRLQRRPRPSVSGAKAKGTLERTALPSVLRQDGLSYLVRHPRCVHRPACDCIGLYFLWCFVRRIWIFRHFQRNHPSVKLRKSLKP